MSIKEKCAQCGGDLGRLDNTNSHTNQNTCIRALRDRYNELVPLWELCQKFVEDNGIFHPEQVYQSDRIIERSYRFVEEICNVVGYAERPKEEEEE